MKSRLSSAPIHSTASASAEATPGVDILDRAMTSGLPRAAAAGASARSGCTCVRGRHASEDELGGGQLEGEDGRVIPLVDVARQDLGQRLADEHELQARSR